MYYKNREASASDRAGFFIDMNSFFLRMIG